MRKLKVDTVVRGVEVTLVGMDSNRSRREPRPDEVELQDVVIGEVSIEPLLSSDDWRVLENELFEAANDMWRGDASEYADNLREERRFG